MSLFRTALVIAAAVMLLPVDEKKQAQFSATASRAAAETATFCQRNVDTCATGRELWGLFVQKAEYGVELGARLIRAQLMSDSAGEQRLTAASTPREQPQWNGNYAAPYDPLPNTAASSEPGSQRRKANLTDNSSRWR